MSFVSGWHSMGMQPCLPSPALICTAVCMLPCRTCLSACHSAFKCVQQALLCVPATWSMSYHLELLCRLSTNMVIYLTRIMGCRPAFAATQVNLFEGTCYLTPVLGAWLADAHWGRYKTILVFSGIYFVVGSYREQSQVSLDLEPTLPSRFYT